ncbi:helix-turn-helix transcriptional regulator [Roseateles sp. LKC17W]|uniref:Response regulator transcription factor n=1 Tax=Pelomonas margarita TaxID=3299031 RepID=A0ABW7FDL1_9BURK
MEREREDWSELTAVLRLPHYQGLDVDCVAVGLSSLDVAAVQIQKILFLEGEIHEDPQTLQSHCASLIAVWSAVRAPSMLDLGECTCVGRRILFGEPKAGRRFSVHAHPLGNGQALFAVFSSTTRWDSAESVKALALDLTERAREVVERVGTGPFPALPDEAAKGLDWYLFTAREIEILKLVAAGLSNKQIARELGSSPNTVRNQIHAVFRKTGVSNRTELALRAAIA